MQPHFCPSSLLSFLQFFNWVIWYLYNTVLFCFSFFFFKLGYKYTSPVPESLGIRDFGPNSREVELYCLLDKGPNKSEGRETIIQSPIKIKIWKHWKQSHTKNLGEKQSLLSSQGPGETNFDGADNHCGRHGTKSGNLVGQDSEKTFQDEETRHSK